MRLLLVLHLLPIAPLAAVLTSAALAQPSITADACQIAPIPAVSTIVGVNRPNLGRVKDFISILQDMRKADVQAVRLTLDPPFETSISTIVEANRLGLKVLLNVPTWWPDFAFNGAIQRPGRPGTQFYSIHRLSDLDVDRYESTLRRVIIAIENRGAQVDAFEIGNEINWAAFNGDLPLTTPGRLFGRANFAEAKESFKIEEGFQRYAAALVATKRVLLKTKQHQLTPVISAGLTGAFATPNSVARTGASLVDLDLSIELFAKYRIFNNVDGIAVHVYVNNSSDKKPSLFRHLFHRVEQATRLCEAGNEWKLPCWITEWGFKEQGNGCNFKIRDSRVRKVQDFQKSIGCLMTERRIHASFIFDWDKSPDYSIWRCGRLLESGQILFH